MKKIILLTTFSLILFSCGNKEDKTNIDALIASKNVMAIKEKRISIQADLAKIDDALATLDTKKEEALVSILTVKDND